MTVEDVDRLLSLYARLVPGLIEAVEGRYNILRHIYYCQPAGRRTLAAALGISERVMRGELEILARQGLLDITPQGVVVTAAGEEVLQALAAHWHHRQGLDELERLLARHLHVSVVVVPGDSAANMAVRRELGRAAAQVLERRLGPGAVVAISGGTTMAEVAAAVRFTRRDALVVPSRGGLGEQLEYQANTIAASLASRLQARYHQLYVPDGLSHEALQVIADNDVQVRTTVNLIKNAHILLHGIGRAVVMARRRGLPPALVDRIVALGAVGEALGYYYDLAGRVVYATDSIGLSLADMVNMKTVIAVAGGADKGAAILAVMRGRGGQPEPPGVLVIDAAAGQAMYHLIKSSQ